MIKKFLASSLFLSILIQTIAVDYSFSITAEERLEEVEKQLIAIANQIKQYEGDKTDLEKAILENDSSLKKVNQELSEVQKRLEAAEKALEKALEGYDESLNNLAAIQENIINEQITLGTTKNQISKVKDELFETQKNLNSAKGELQNKAVDMYINGVMSPATALFINLSDLSDFLAALGYASAIVNTAYEIIESLNAFERLSETQTEFLSEREKEREEIIENLQVEEEKKNQISIEAEEYADEVEESKNRVETEKRRVENKKAAVLVERKKAQNLLTEANNQLAKLDAEHANLEKLEDAIQADIERLSSLGGVAPNKLTWPITGSYVSSGYKWRRFRGVIRQGSGNGSYYKDRSWRGRCECRTYSWTTTNDRKVQTR